MVFCSFYIVLLNDTPRVALPYSCVKSRLLGMAAQQQEAIAFTIVNMTSFCWMRAQECNLHEDTRNILDLKLNSCMISLCNIQNEGSIKFESSNLICSFSPSCWLAIATNLWIFGYILKVIHSYTHKNVLSIAMSSPSRMDRNCWRSSDCKSGACKNAKNDWFRVESNHVILECVPDRIQWDQRDLELLCEYHCTIHCTPWMGLDL